MVQDTLGMLFFSTAESLILFDGTEWTSLAFNSGVIYSLFRDSRGDLWYGATHDFGRIRRSRESGFVLESFAYMVPDSIRLFGNIVNIVEYDSSCFFHSSAYVFKVKNDKVEVINHNSSYPKGFVVGGEYFVNHNTSGFAVYQLGQFNPVQGGEFYRDKTVVGMAELYPDSVLIGTRTNGLFIFTPSTGRSYKWNSPGKAITESLQMTRLLHLKPLDGGEIAFSTSDKGTFITDNSGNILRKLNKSSGTLDNRHQFAYTTSSNILWMCTGRGISIYNMDIPLYLWGPEEGIPEVIYAISSFQGSVLIGTSSGLFILSDPLNPDGQVKRILNIPCWGISEVSDGSNGEIILLNTQDGLFRYDENIPDFLFSGNIFRTVQLNINSDFYISVGLSGLHAFSLIDGIIEEYQLLEYQFTDVNSVVQDNRDIWITYSSVGKLFRISQQEIIDHLLAGSLQDISYKEITIDSPVKGFNVGDDSFLFSSKDGFLEFDSLTGSLRRLQSWGRDVAGYNRSATSMSRDLKGNIWLGGNDILLNRYDGTYGVYNMSIEGVHDNLSGTIVHHDEFGRIWMGGNRGVILIDSLVTTDYEVSHVIITRLVQKDTLVHHIYRADTTYSNNPAFSLRENNDISVYYSIPFYGGSPGIKYSFRMDGYLDRWSNWTTESHIFIPQMKPGRYTFLVKAQLPNGKETMPSYISFEIERMWYETVLIKVAIAFILILTGYQLVRVYFRNRFRREMATELLLRQKVREQFMIKLAETLTISPTVRDTENKSEKDLTSSIVSGRQSKFIDRLTYLVEKNLDDSDLSVEKLAGMMNMSQKMLYRRVKSSTGLSIISFIRKIRLKNSAVLLVSTDLSVAEVAYRVGFKDPSYFTKSFGQEFDKTPVQFQKEMDKIRKGNTGE
jgi:AraC-like DNA-binding protein/ligand-binding sensor domain-containing protein